LELTGFKLWSFVEKEGYLKRDAKLTDVTGEKIFSTETYINAPTKAFGGDEEIVLKGRRGKSKDSINLYAQRSSGLMYAEYRLPTEAEWEYAAVANVGNREYNLYQGQKKYPWSGSYTRSGFRVGLMMVLILHKL